MPLQLSLPRDRISVLLLEGISQSAVDYFSSCGYTNLVHLPKALDDKDLKSHIADAHIIGIRSRTQLTEEIFESAKKLIAVGCFSVGTNQVDLEAARRRGIPVFNAPYSNTRSVAELVIGEIIMLIQLNEIFSSRGLNIVAEFLQTHGDTGYVVIEVEDMSQTADDILQALREIPGTIRTRLLY